MKPSLDEILQVLSVTPFEKVPIAGLYVPRSTYLDTRNFTDGIPNLCWDGWLMADTTDITLEDK